MPKEYHVVRCAQCGEELTAPAWSGHGNAQEARNLWHCPNCGYMFESLEPINALPIELAETFLPSLVME